MMSETEQQRLISTFLEITVEETVTTAQRFLRATSWNLQEALHLFYAGNQNPPDLQNDNVAEDEDPAPSSSMASHHDPAPRINASLVWDLEDDDSSEDGDPRGMDPSYMPPFHLLFYGSFHQAKYDASHQDKWLLVNLQSIEELASHTLNRDTWGDVAVWRIILDKFIFLQAEHDKSTGRKIHTFYRIESVPVVLVIDPITGQKMRQWYGMIEGKTLLQDLAPFMDFGPHHQLSHPMFKKQHPRRGSSSTTPHTETTQELQLQKPLVASLESIKTEALSETNQTGSSNVTPTSPHPPQEPSASVESIKTVTGSSNAMNVFPPLPQEPTGHDPGVSCRVGVRFPDGRKLVRRFLREEPIQLLWSFCCSQIQEPEVKPFQLVERRTIGSSKTLEYDSDLTFEEAGLANSMVFLSWP